jgi:hypothetical protein
MKGLVSSVGNQSMVPHFLTWKMEFSTLEENPLLYAAVEIPLIAKNAMNGAPRHLSFRWSRKGRDTLLAH